MHGLRITDEHNRCFSNSKSCFCEFCIHRILVFPTENHGLRNPHEHNRYFSNLKSCFCEFRINNIIVFPMAKHCLQNPDEHNCCFSYSKSGFLNFRIHRITAFPTGKAWSAKSRRAQPLLFKNMFLKAFVNSAFTESLLFQFWKTCSDHSRRTQPLLLQFKKMLPWIPHLQNHVFSNLEKHGLRNPDKHHLCVSNSNSCFSELCIDRIIAFLIGKVRSWKSRRAQLMFFSINKLLL